MIWLLFNCSSRVVHVRRIPCVKFNPEIFISSHFFPMCASFFIFLLSNKCWRVEEIFIKWTLKNRKIEKFTNLDLHQIPVVMKRLNVNSFRLNSEQKLNFYKNGRWKFGKLKKIINLDWINYNLHQIPVVMKRLIYWNNNKFIYTKFWRRIETENFN